ncbi:MAG: transposase [Acetatifactor sp.]|nr:transposase [Acetatifactor sp.]
MALKYTKETIIQLFLSQQEQLENIDHNPQLVPEQLADLKRHRFGRSPERHEPDEQLSFMEVDGKIVFFNESEAVAAEGSGEDPEAVPRRKPKRRQGKREEDLEGLPVVVVEHSMTEELAALFGEGGWKQP